MILEDGRLVKVYHRRVAIGFEPPRLLFAPRGGQTHVIIMGEDGETELAYGHAWCSPKDNYNKKIGRTIAVGRALKFLRMKEIESVRVDTGTDGGSTGGEDVGRDEPWLGEKGEHQIH